jgi:RNA polymerase sigma-70 factor (ECF subfamily)
VQADEGIARRLQRCDPETWSGIYEEYFPRIYRYIALRVRSREEAEDMAGQVFLKALESISSFKWRGVPVAAWLFRIAHNQVIDYWRNAKSKGSLPLDESLVSNDIDPEEVAETNLDISRLVKALRQLTKAQREVIELRFAAELSTAEVAKILDKSQGAVKVLQHNALKTLRGRLSELEQP